jgi:hypothetical protein
VQSYWLKQVLSPTFLGSKSFPPMNAETISSNESELLCRDGLRRHFTFIARISPIFRRRRTAAFLRLFKPGPETRILDVGGLPRYWEGAVLASPMTITNLEPLDSYEASFLSSNQTFVPSDATRMPWDDQSFDIVFSNSVIEHMGTAEQQEAFVRECRRVGKGFWIQTPAKEFPLEPHFLALFLHWFPKATQRRFLRRFTVWGLLARPCDEILDAVMAELRLLTRREFRRLLPDARLITERFLGLPKSYVAYKVCS